MSADRNGKGTFLVSIVSLGVLILIAGIPWGYSIHGRVVGIEEAQKTTNRRLGGIERRLEAPPPRWLVEKIKRLEEELKEKK